MQHIPAPVCCTTVQHAEAALLSKALPNVACTIQCVVHNRTLLLHEVFSSLFLIAGAVMTDRVQKSSCNRSVLQRIHVALLKQDLRSLIQQALVRSKLLQLSYGMCSYAVLRSTCWQGRQGCRAKAYKASARQGQDKSLSCAGLVRLRPAAFPAFAVLCSAVLPLPGTCLGYLCCAVLCSTVLPLPGTCLACLCPAAFPAFAMLCSTVL